MEAGTVEEELGLAYIASVMNPERANVQPPSVLNRVTLAKSVTTTASWTVNDVGIGATHAKIRTSDGIVIYRPLQGVNSSLDRYGIMPVGTSFEPFGPLAFGLTNPYTYADSVTFNQQLAIPYGPQVPGDRVEINPTMSDQFSLTLNTAAVGKFWSDTVPSGNQPLNGWITVAAVADSRDVCQTADGAFPPAALRQSSVTEYDSIMREAAYNGVAWIQGPDLATEFGPPDSERRDEPNGVWADDTTLNSSGILNGAFFPRNDPAVTFAVGVPEGTVVPLGAIWICPWAGVTWADSGGKPLVNINTESRIGESGCLDFRLAVRPAIFAVGGGISSQAAQFYWVVSHYFITCSSNHEAEWRVVTETRYGPIIQGTPAPPGDNFGSRFYWTEQFDQRALLASGGIHGRYVGSFAVAACQVINVTGPAGFGVYIDTSNEFPPRLLIRDNSGGLQREYGPNRIAYYNGLTDGQVLRFEGNIVCACIAEAGLAPYIQAAMRNGSSALNSDIQLYLQRLFLLPGEYRRVYRLQDYLRLIARQYSTGTGSKEHVMDTISDNPVAVAGALSAGIFHDIGHSLGGAVGSAVGGLASQGLGALGSMVDSVFSAGQFQAMPSNGAQAGGGAFSAGEFQAGGQFRRQRGY